MAGEMSRSDLTPDGDWGLFVRAAGMLEGAGIYPFDVYRGPYVRYAGHKFWFTNNFQRPLPRGERIDGQPATSG